MTKRGDADRAVELRIGETYIWVLVPTQPEATGAVAWDAVKADGQGVLPVRVGKKLEALGHLNVSYPAVLLRQQLDGVLASMWEAGHVQVDAVWDAFARYVYLPRLRDLAVLISAVQQGPASLQWDVEGFATADALDSAGKLLGLVAGAHPGGVTGKTLIVRPDIARPLIEASSPVPPGVDGPAPGETDAEGITPPPPDGTSTVAETRVQRFYGAVVLNPERVSRDFGKVAQEVITHLAGLIGTTIKVSVEIEATNEDGFPDQIVRSVSENAKTLGFDGHEFYKK